MTTQAATEKKMPNQTNRQRGGLATTSAKRDRRGTLLANLHPLERMFAEIEWPERRAFARVRKRARERALEVLDDGAGEQQSHTALLVAAAELFGALGVELAASPRPAAELVERLERGLGLSRVGLAREVLRAPELLTMPPGVAIEVQLGMLLAFAPLRSASLWRLETGARVNCLCHVGEGAPSRGARQLARQLLAGQAQRPRERSLLLGFAIEHAGQPIAALVASVCPRGRERSCALMSEALPMFAALAQRETLLAENAASVRALVESSERKLTRLGFDLHDGPIQDVAVLAQDLRLFRDQLELVVGPLTKHEHVRGRIEDLDAQVAALDGELRRLSGEVQAASVLLNRPFPAALRERVRAFTARTGIRPRVTLTGVASLLSASQQIALLNIIQEALSNVREHAHATKVAISVAVDRRGAQAKVIDDGRGFELEATMMRAAREGRMGLLGMNERVRLLGGRCSIESRPGGPTIVSVALDPWLHPGRVIPDDRSRQRRTGNAVGAGSDRPSRRQAVAPASGVSAARSFSKA